MLLPNYNLRQSFQEIEETFQERGNRDEDE